MSVEKIEFHKVDLEMSEWPVRSIYTKKKITPPRPGTKISRRSFYGFTLIELVLATAILGLLLSIVVPKFADMIEKSREARDKGVMGALRSAISIYYADNEGFAPFLLLTGLVPRYMDRVERPWPPPKSISSRHNPVNRFIPNVGGVGNQLISNIILNGGDGGEWFYRYAQSGQTFFLNVNCTHQDIRGSVWSQF